MKLHSNDTAYPTIFLLIFTSNVTFTMDSSWLVWDEVNSTPNYDVESSLFSDNTIGVESLSLRTDPTEKSPQAFVAPFQEHSPEQTTLGLSHAAMYAQSCKNNEQFLKNVPKDSPLYEPFVRILHITAYGLIARRRWLKEFIEKNISNLHLYPLINTIPIDENGAPLILKMHQWHFQKLLALLKQHNMVDYSALDLYGNNSEWYWRNADLE